MPHGHGHSQPPGTKGVPVSELSPTLSPMPQTVHPPGPSSTGDSSDNEVKRYFYQILFVGKFIHTTPLSTRDTDSSSFLWYLFISLNTVLQMWSWILSACFSELDVFCPQDSFRFFTYSMRKKCFSSCYSRVFSENKKNGWLFKKYLTWWRYY